MTAIRLAVVEAMSARGFAVSSAHAGVITFKNAGRRLEIKLPSAVREYHDIDGLVGRFVKRARADG